MEGYQQLYNESRWDDETLKELFWSGMDDTLSQLLLFGDDYQPFSEFVDYTLQVCRASLTLGVVENNITINSDS